MTDIEKSYSWTKKGKRYKIQYFSALGKLFEEVMDDSKASRDDGVAAIPGSGGDTVSEPTKERPQEAPSEPR